MNIITLTDNAIKILKTVQTEDDRYLRIAISAGGCSGFSYQLGFDKEYNEEKDNKFEQAGITILVDKKSALYLDGTTLDYYEDPNDLSQRGFVFENPQSKGNCGCGSSFQV